jgi:hypothetical protein
MQHLEIKNEVVAIVAGADGQFMSAYQICQHLKKDYKPLWDRLVAEYPSADPATPMGEGTGVKFSPATFVAQALAAFAKAGNVQGLRHERLFCEGVSFSGTDPGYTGHVIGIWAIKNS